MVATCINTPAIIPPATPSMQAAISFDHLIGEGQAASGHLSAPSKWGCGQARNGTVDGGYPVPAARTVTVHLILIISLHFVLGGDVGR